MTASLQLTATQNAVEYEQIFSCVNNTFGDRGLTTANGSMKVLH